MRLAVVVTSAVSVGFNRVAGLTLLLAKLVVFALVISYYEHTKLYSPWTLLLLKGGSSLFIYVLSKLTTDV